MKGTRFLIQLLLILFHTSACAHADESKPITNPFVSYHGGPNGDPSQNMILRTKKGDRSVELELPADAESLSDFVIPVSPAFKDQNRSPASVDENNLDDSYKNHKPTQSDREITNSLPQSVLPDDGRIQEIEKGLDLTPSEDPSANQATASYLAATDHIKQLYRGARYEAALLEVDEMLRQYPTDPILYEMRGTLLDRLGRRELALKSWNQALKFNPNNKGLKRFVERKELLTGVSP